MINNTGRYYYKIHWACDGSEDKVTTVAIYRPDGSLLRNYVSDWENTTTHEVMAEVNLEIIKLNT